MISLRGYAEAAALVSSLVGWRAVFGGFSGRGRVLTTSLAVAGLFVVVVAAQVLVWLCRLHGGAAVLPVISFAELAERFVPLGLHAVVVPTMAAGTSCGRAQWSIWFGASLAWVFLAFVPMAWLLVDPASPWNETLDGRAFLWSTEAVMGGATLWAIQRTTTLPSATPPRLGLVLAGTAAVIGPSFFISMASTDSQTTGLVIRWLPVVAGTLGWALVRRRLGARTDMAEVLIAVLFSFVATEPFTFHVPVLIALLAGACVGALGALMRRAEDDWSEARLAFSIFGIGTLLGTVVRAVFSNGSWDPSARDGLAFGGGVEALTGLAFVVGASLHAMVIGLLIVRASVIVRSLRGRRLEREDC